VYLARVVVAEIYSGRVLAGADVAETAPLEETPLVGSPNSSVQVLEDGAGRVAETPRATQVQWRAVKL
jgi:hypothetical protein